MLTNHHIMVGNTTFEIGGNIKKLREFSGYSQEFMANELDISQKTYSNIENDTGKVSKEQIENIAGILEIDPILLLSFDDKVIFQNENCNQAGMFKVNTYNESSGIERELFEKRIEEQKELFEKRVAELKEEITFLRSLIKQQYDEN